MTLSTGAGWSLPRWKYAFYETGHQLLFDLENDPFEMNNLVETDPETCAAMREKLLELLADSREPYFDVLIEDGAPVQGPALDVGESRRKGNLAPVWPDLVRRLES